MAHAFVRVSRALGMTSPARRALCVALCGGVTFLLLFHLGYLRIDSDYYQLRDDGIITLSHARNLVDYGFIGTSPSGDRVEGYSAPVQMFTYAAA
jgi:hypothetical protein